MTVTRAIAMDCRVKPCDGVVSCDLADEAVLLHIPSGTYFGLDNVGLEIWSNIQQARTVNEICSHLVERYDVQPERCCADLIRLLQRMAEHGLILIESNA